MKTTRSKLLSVLVGLVGAAYIAIPFDALPDFVVGLGWSDDAVALVTAVVTIITILRKGTVRQQVSPRS